MGRRMKPCQAIPATRLQENQLMHRSTLAAAILPLILVLAAYSSGGGATTAPASQPAASAPASSAPAASGAAGASASAETSETYELKVAAGSGSVTNYLTGEERLRRGAVPRQLAPVRRRIPRRGQARQWCHRQARADHPR